MCKLIYAYIIKRKTVTAIKNQFVTQLKKYYKIKNWNLKNAIEIQFVTQCEKNY